MTKIIRYNLSNKDMRIKSAISYAVRSAIKKMGMKEFKKTSFFVSNQGKK